MGICRPSTGIPSTDRFPLKTIYKYVYQMHTGQNPYKDKGTPEDSGYYIAASRNTKETPKEHSRNANLIDEVNYLKWPSGLQKSWNPKYQEADEPQRSQQPLRKRQSASCEFSSKHQTYSHYEYGPL